MTSECRSSTHVVVSFPVEVTPDGAFLSRLHVGRRFLSVPDVFLRSQLVGAEKPYAEQVTPGTQQANLVGDTQQSAFIARGTTHAGERFRSLPALECD